MLFNSFHFLIFFPIVAIYYFICPYRYRWILLLCASYYFYMCWKPVYALLIVVSTLVDYFCGLRMEKEATKQGRRKYLYFSLVCNLGLLFVFKYFNFFSNSFENVFNYFNFNYNTPAFKLLLPIGISFYTFQTLSYTIDVYRGNKKAEKHLGIFALYVSFFPQLVAGPIERAQNLLPQFAKKIDFDYNRVRRGLQLMMWGMFKKVVIADRLAVLVDVVYNDPAQYQGLSLVTATVFFAFQIYYDFSGYSDIAIGAAEVLGYKLMKNFNNPYFAKSLQDFWRRWHISLSSWFKDYVYISLGGNRTKNSRWIFSIFVTFLLSGLWHGANWTFVIWGGLHGFLYLLGVRCNIGRKIDNDATQHRVISKFEDFLTITVNFSLVCYAWIFFRSNNIQEALYIATGIFFNWNKQISFGFDAGALGLTFNDFVLNILLIVFAESIHSLQSFGSVRDRLSRCPIYLRWAVYVLLILAMMNLRATNEIPFIYFQF